MRKLKRSIMRARSKGICPINDSATCMGLWSNNIIKQINTPPKIETFNQLSFSNGSFKNEELNDAPRT
jgi:hypothetical protein